MAIFFYIDPMSYDNLEEYDINVLSEFNTDEVLFLGSCKMKKKPKVKSKLIYRYSDKKGVKKVFSFLISQFIMLRLVWFNKPRVIHFQWLKIPHFDFFLFKVLKFINPKVKIIFTAHNILPHNSGNKFFKIFKKIYLYVDKIIVHDNNTKAKLINKFNIPGNKIDVIQHGLISLPRNDNVVNTFLKTNAFQDKIVFTIIGNISKYKGIDLVYEVWSNCKEIYDNKKIQLVIAGRGDEVYFEKFKNFRNVLLVNKYLTDDEFVAYVKLSDVILMPYREISQSGVLLTAINENKLVIVSNRGGLTDPFKIANIGWILPKLNVKEIQKAILNAASISKTEKYIDIEAKEKLKDFYSWERISKKTEKLYQKLANDK